VGGREIINYLNIYKLLLLFVFMGNKKQVGWRLVTSNFQALQLRRGNFQYGVIPTIDFDPDLPLNHPVNGEAARQRDLTYDFDREHYVDEDGCLIRDGFGQPL